ncbi:MAG: hypothetical protein M1140_03075, partial [Chloroflexi bacterium]|nr:hypothetical protein [Chloroflexota bacterium]
QPSVTQLTAAPLLSRPYFCIQFHLHIIACYRDVYKDQHFRGNDTESAFGIAAEKVWPHPEAPLAG